MKRLLGAAFAAALGATALFGIATPASAHGHDLCAGQGSASTGAVFYPTFGPSATGSVSFSFTIGGCLLGHGNTASGSFSAGVVGNFCGHSTGTVSLDGHAASWVSAGSMLVLAPAGGVGSSMAGVVNAVPNALTGQSCTTGATDFLVTGAVALF